MVTVGSLFSGYGGLDLGIQMALGEMRTAWVSDIGAGPNAILAKRFPDAPNLGDITQIDWTQVEPVDILAGGFPCQPVSVAGRRKGVTDERWLFDEILKGLRIMDPSPQLCVFENVPGLLTANRGSAMARVIEGLASLGYVGHYGIQSAASVGAAQLRERVFIIAYPVNESPQFSLTDLLRLSRPSSSDFESVKLLPALTSQRPDGRKSESFANGRENFYNIIQNDRWVEFEDGIHRWEKVLGRTHPNPVTITKKGHRALSTRWMEWFMGLPKGWVTDVGLSATAETHALGNGVVPQQAALAVSGLLRRVQW